MSSTLGLFLVSKLWIWIRNQGGPGLLLLGIADNSLIPMPGSMDVLTIWLAVHHRKEWYYFAIMATAGSLLGGYITYRLARKGGKKALRSRLGPGRTKSFSKRFERWGFWGIVIPALLPPPFPFVPFLMVAGALQYPRKKFVAALVVGRGLRYTILAYLGVQYGRHFLHFFNKYTKPTFFVLLSVAVIASILALVTYLRYRNQSESGADVPMSASGQRAG